MTTAEAPDGITLTGPDGLSLRVPDFFVELPERESAQVPLVATIDSGQGFHPTITVAVAAATPDLASIEQLGAGAVGAQLELGRLVVAVDVWPVEGQDDGRRVISLYADGAETVLQLQYLTLRSGRAITLSLEALASAHHFGLEVFRYVTGTLRCDGAVGQVLPSPSPRRDSMPEGDHFAASRGVSLEHLGGIRSRQPFHSAGPSLDVDDVKALRAGMKRRRRGRDTLIAAGLVDADGQLTRIGSAAHDLLGRSRAQLVAEVIVPGDDEPYVLEAFLRDSEVAVLADPPPGTVGSRRTLDLIPGLTLPVTLARWLGLAPAWTFNIAEPPDAGVAIERSVWEARLADPQAPAPAGAAGSFARLWEQPWQVATIRTSERWKNGRGFLQFLSTPEAGYALVFLGVSRSRPVRLESRPGAQLLHALLIVSGLVSPRNPQ